MIIRLAKLAIIVFSVGALVFSAPSHQGAYTAQAAGAVCPIRSSGDFLATYSGTVTGKVQSGWFWQAQPLGSVLVEVQVLGGRKYTVSTDTSGHFNISAIHLPTKPGYANVRLSRADFVAKNFAVNLGEGDNSAPLTLDYPLAYSGTPKAFWGYVYEQVKDPNYPAGHTINRNIAGAAVYIYKEDDTTYSTPVTLAIADANGRYEIPAGRARIEQGLRYVVGSWNSTTHAQTGIGERRLYPYDNPDLNTPYMSAQFNQSGQVDVRQDELVVEGKVTLKNTGWIVSDAQVSIVQNNHRFPQPTNPLIPEVDSATRVNSFGQYAVTSWSHEAEVNPGKPVLVPGNATLQIQFLDGAGHLQPVFFSQSITIKKGRNVVNPDIDAALVCGTLTLKDTELTFPGVPVELKQGDITQSATTNLDGNYQDFSENTLTTSPSGGTILSNYSVNVASSGQKPIKGGTLTKTPKFEASTDDIPSYEIMRDSPADQQIAAGTNNASQTVESGMPNTIYGTLSGETDLAGYQIRIYQNKDGVRTLLGQTISKDDGTYKFQSSDIKANIDYEVEPWIGTSDMATKVGPTVRVSKPRSSIDNSIKADLTTTNTSTTPMYDITVKVRSQNNGKYYPLENAKASLYDNSNLEDKIVSSSTDSTGKTAWKNLKLKNGKYLIDVKREDLDFEFGKVIRLIDKPSKTIPLTVLVIYRPDKCTNRSSTHISKFWVCGDDASTFYSNNQAIVDYIDNRISSLRNKYYVYNSTLPLQVALQDSQDEPSYFFAPTSDLCPPQPILNPAISNLPRGETIGLIIDDIPVNFDNNRKIGMVNQIFTHEWGHGKDYRKALCNGMSSDEKPFYSLYKLGKYYNMYFKTLKDSTYYADGPHFGHPEDNPTETYASAFTAMSLHESEFKFRITFLNAGNTNKTKFLQNLLLQTGNIVVSMR